MGAHFALRFPTWAAPRRLFQSLTLFNYVEMFAKDFVDVGSVIVICHDQVGLPMVTSYLAVIGQNIFAVKCSGFINGVFNHASWIPLLQEHSPEIGDISFKFLFF